MDIFQSVRIPYPLYQDLLDYLSAHAAGDDWSSNLLNRLQSESKTSKEPIPETETIGDDEKDFSLPLN
jgi:hypothetical protein